MRTRTWQLAVVASLCLGTVGGPLPAGAWWGGGHEAMTRASLRALPAQLPAFFRAGEDLAAHVAYDPDLLKNRAVPQLGRAEEPEHYWDVELLRGATPPDTRYAFLDLCVRLKQKPSRVGLLPYAVAEWTQRLAVAFAEHRAWPQDSHIQAKCLVYAGFLAHYAQDLCQPLHVTQDYDGRKGADGKVQGEGIHEWMDRLIERLDLDAGRLAAVPRPLAADGLMPAIWDEIETSRARLDAVYDLGPQLRGGTGKAVEAMALERARAGVRFTASLYQCAWETSASVNLPDWLKR